MSTRTITRTLRLVVTMGVAGGALFALAGPAAADFRNDADELCASDFQALNDWERDNGVPLDAAGQQARLADVLPTQEDNADALENIAAPKKLRAKYDAFLEAHRARLEGSQAYLDAVEAGDEDAIDAARDDNADLDQDENATARAVGLFACAERLPKADERKVRATVVRTFTHSDPDYCTEQYTEAYVEAFSGSLEQCEADETPENANDSVEIDNVQGVAKTRVNVDFVGDGGPGSGEPTRVVLVYEDGTWKRQGIFSLAS